MLSKNDRVLFIGDSITHAHRRPDELHDCYSLGCGYVNLLASRLKAGRPALHLEFINRGECGNRVDHLSLRWERDCLDLRPSVISILIGINDAHESSPHADDSATYRRIYGALLERTLAVLPEVRLILMEPFALDVPPPRAPAIRATDAQLTRVRRFQPVVAELAERHGARFVPLQERFNEALSRATPAHWALDGIHPSTAGHELIARAWLAATGMDGVG